MTAIKKTLITSALPYINGIKHLGNLAGSLLPADIHARYRRQTGDEVLFICATDEHGTPAELAAAAAGVCVADYCAEQHAVQADIYRRLNLSFDHFGRSSSPQNRALTQHFFKCLDDCGFIEERTLNQVYSLDDKRFLADRYIVGTCPHCGSDRARGDQCDNCSRLLEPTDLIRPRSAVSGGTKLEVRPTRHLFLRQQALTGDLETWLASRKGWPHLVTSIARKWLDEGIHDRCITRDLTWGVSRCRSQASKARCFTSGSTPRSNTSRRHRNGPTPIRTTGTGGSGGGRLMTSSTCSFWARTTCHFTRFRFLARCWDPESRGRPST
jgi:methionyl-tRNA synthetase